MKKLILIILLSPFFNTIQGQLNNNGLQDYEQSYNSVINRLNDASFESKERKKINKYFNKQQYAEAEEYAKKREEKVGHGNYDIVADNYFLKGKEAMGNNNYKTAIDIFNKSLLYYNKAGYGSTSSFVKRDIGFCYLQLFDDNLNDYSLIDKCFENFEQSNSSDLIDKYIDFFSLVYLDKYKNTSIKKNLENAYLSCYNSQNIQKFDSQCTIVADFLIEEYRKSRHEIEYLENANSLYTKLEKTDKLDVAFIAYKELFDYYINSSNPIVKLKRFIESTAFSEYKQMAQQKIYQIEYDNLKSKNTIAAFEAFVENNADNPNWNESITILNSMLETDQQEFDYAKTIDTHASYNKYLKHNPYGKFTSEATALKNKLPVISNIRGVANGSKIDIHFHLYVEGEAVFDKIYNSKDIEMTSLEGNLGNYFNTGDYKITWDVLKDTKTLEGNVTFFVEFEEKHFTEPVYHESGEDDELSVYNPEYEEEVSEAEIFTVVEKMPEFPGGINKLYAFLSRNIKYPPLAKESGIMGRVFINFVVEPDGTISNVRVLRGIGGGCDEESIRVVKAMPKWEPGMQRGKEVRVSYNLPIKFTLN